MIPVFLDSEKPEQVAIVEDILLDGKHDVSSILEQQLVTTRLFCSCQDCFGNGFSLRIHYTCIHGDTLNTITNTNGCKIREIVIWPQNGGQDIELTVIEKNLIEDT